MSSLRRFGREELAAIAVAGTLVVALVVSWLHYRVKPERCCDGVARRANDSLPVDPFLHSGRLDNGLRYFVRSNRLPKQRAELRLVVNVGSVVEEQDERGIAHAVEHMLFRGTRRFPRRTVQDYLESVGMRNGEDLNGRTSRDETTFELRVPTDRLGVLDTAVAMLADMAHEAVFDPVEARIEGGIVMAEWRSDRSARDRLAEQRDSILLAGSMYAMRSPIGDTAILRRFDVETMRRFYQRWYRPDLMAIVAVGDFDPVMVERLVKRYFGAIPASRTTSPRPTIPAPRLTGVRAYALVDADATGTELSLYIPHPVVTRATTTSYRHRATTGVWRAILDARLREAAERPDSPFLGVRVDQRQLTRSVDAEVLTTAVPDGRIREAADELIDEINRLMRYGPSEREVREQIDATLRMRRQSAQWADDSGDLVSGYAEEFLTGNRAMTRATSLQVANEVLTTLGVEDVTAMARRLTLDSGAYAFTTSPTTSAAPSSALLMQVVRHAMQRAVERRERASDSVVLVLHPPASGSVRSERPLTDVGAYDWTLSNEMRVILKPTRFAFDQFEFRLFAPGGASLAGDSAFASAYYSDEVMRATGVGDLDGRRLGRRLDASSIDLSLNVDDAAIEFRGFAAPDDLELLFQVLHLYFTSPRGDTLAFRRWMDRRLAMAARRHGDPDAAFADSLAAAITQHHPSAIRADRAFIRQVELSRVLAFWRARTANAANFTLVLSGDFTLDRVRTLAARYFASLPGGSREGPRDEGIRFPSTAVQRSFRAGPGPKARTSIVLSGPFDQVEGSSEALSAARDLAELALTTRLREILGATYGVNVSGSTDLIPPLGYRLAIGFESDPAQMDSLTAVALLELERLRTVGPTEAEAAKVRASETRDLDNKIDDNSYWADELAWHSRAGLSLASITTHQANARALTRDALRDACAKYLGAARHVRVTMLPRQTRAHLPTPAPSSGESGGGRGR